MFGQDSDKGNHSLSVRAVGVLKVQLSRAILQVGKQVLGFGAGQPSRTQPGEFAA